MVVLKRYKRGFTQKNIICFDVETTVPDYNIPFALKLAVIENKGNYCTVYNSDDLTKQIVNFCRTKINIVFATNTEFDFSFINHKLLGELGFDLISFNNAPFFSIYKNRGKRQSILFLDTMNFVRMGLESIGKMVGIEKGKIDFKTCTMDELKEYCINDVKITREFVTWIEDLHDLYDVDFCFTFPQLSYRVFRKHYLDVDLFISDNKQVRLLERNSYRGGRVEVFKFGRVEEAYYNDFNSLYPYVMKNNCYPIECLEYFSEDNCNIYSLLQLKQKITQEHIIGNGIIARVVVDIPLMKIGKVPLFYSGKTMFPCGRFEASLCTPELEEIEQYIVGIKEIAVYKMYNLFEGFVTDFYNKRLGAKQDNDIIMDLFYKLFMACLYGKFGQRKFDEKRLEEFDGLYDYHSQSLYDEEKDMMYYARWIGGKCYVKSVSLDNPRSFVGIASFVTAYARVRLLRVLEEHENEVIYCDTDSIVLEKPIEDNLLLGGLKVEKVYFGFNPLGNKMYKFDGGYYMKDGAKVVFSKGYKFKGIRQNKVSDKSPTEIEKSPLYIYVKTDKITRFQESVKRFNSDKPRMIELEKVLSLAYDKRVVLSNGNTYPIFIEHYT